MKIARETDYAVRCLLHMAGRDGGIFTVREISINRGIPPTFLAKILQKLGKAEIASSIRGSRGGFRLARHPRAITLLSVIEAVEGPLAPNACLVEGNRCSRTNRCAVHPVWRELREIIGAKLEEVTLQQLVEEEDAMNLQKFGMAREGT